jgi:putative superfamily III holin-X
MAEQYSSLPSAFSKVITDLADLMQKEMRLIRAELSENISTGIRAGVWVLVAGGLATVAVLLVVQAMVLGLAAATGIALHWSCLIVAALLAAAAGATYAKGKADVPDELTPDRAIHQIKQDIAVAREQFT